MTKSGRDLSTFSTGRQTRRLRAAGGPDERRASARAALREQAHVKGTTACAVQPTSARKRCGGSSRAGCEPSSCWAVRHRDGVVGSISAPMAQPSSQSSAFDDLRARHRSPAARQKRTTPQPTVRRHRAPRQPAPRFRRSPPQAFEWALKRQKRSRSPSVVLFAASHRSGHPVARTNFRRERALVQMLRVAHGTRRALRGARSSTESSSM